MLRTPSLLSLLFIYPKTYVCGLSKLFRHVTCSKQFPNGHLKLNHKGRQSSTYYAVLGIWLLAWCMQHFQKRHLVVIHAVMFFQFCMGRESLYIVFDGMKSSSRTLLPISSRNAWDLQPGASYKFVLHTIIWQRKGPPYGECADRDKTSGLKYTLEDDNSTYKYDTATCRGLCIQEKILKHCSCKDSRLPFTKDLAVDYPNVDYCRSLRNGDSTKVAERISCMDGTKLKSSGKACGLKCLEPCLQYDFQLFSTMSKWPHASFQLPLFQVRSEHQQRALLEKETSRDDYKIGEVPVTAETGSGDGSGEGDFGYSYTDGRSPLDNHYEKINNLVQKALKNITAPDHESMMAEARQMLLTSDLMQRNFIKIKVVRPSHDVMYVEEIPELGISSFLSGIGGAMNFWMGITLIVVMEIVEFVFDLFDLAFGDKNAKKRNKKNEKCENCEDKNNTEAVRV